MYRQGLNQFRTVRAETLRLAAGISQARADFRPAPKEWSPGEILDHLLLAEKLYRGVFADLIALDKAGKRPTMFVGFDEVNTSIFGIPREILPLLTAPFTIFNLFVPPLARDIMLRYRIAPARNPSVASPVRGKPVDELSAELAASLRETEDLFAANPDANYRAMRFHHPMMGSNDAARIFRLVALHEQRHQTQLQAALAAAVRQGIGVADLEPSVTK